MFTLYLLALHFFNGPLARIPPGPLAASIVAVIALLTPLYQLIVRACWRDGLADLTDPTVWWAKWLKVASEIRNYREAEAAPAAQDADKLRLGSHQALSEPAGEKPPANGKDTADQLRDGNEDQSVMIDKAHDIHDHREPPSALA